MVIMRVSALLYRIDRALNNTCQVCSQDQYRTSGSTLVFTTDPSSTWTQRRLAALSVVGLLW